MRPKTLLIVFLAIALVFDVTGSIIAMSTAGGGGLLQQSGFASCTMTTSQTVCLPATQTFAAPYTSIPSNITQWKGQQPQAIALSSTVQAYQNHVMIQANNATAWFNMTSHDTPLELYGQSNQRVVIPQAPSGISNTLALGLCVNVIQASQNVTAAIRIQFSTDGATWQEFTPLTPGDMIEVNVGSSSLGINCVPYPKGNCGVPIFCQFINFPTGTPTTGFYIRAVGLDGASNTYCSPVCLTGCSVNNQDLLRVDCPVFGDIEFLWEYVQTISFSSPDYCAPFVFAISTMTIRVGVRCTLAPSTSTTFSILWITIGT